MRYRAIKPLDVMDDTITIKGELYEITVLTSSYFTISGTFTDGYYPGLIINTYELEQYFELPFSGPLRRRLNED